MAPRISKIAKYIGVSVYRRPYLIWSPVITLVYTASYAYQKKKLKIKSQKCFCPHSRRAALKPF